MRDTRVTHGVDSDSISFFLDRMRQEGLEPVGPVMADGELHRVRWQGDKRGGRPGWYVLHDGKRPHGAFGCWRRGVDVRWCTQGQRLTREERQALTALRKEEQRRRRIEQERRQEKAAELAARIWDAAKPCDDHPYLRHKVIGGHGCRRGARGQLVVPMRDATGKLASLQLIGADGTKRYLAGGKVEDAHHIIGEIQSRAVICEGFSTAASIHETTSIPVVVSFASGQLGNVAKAISIKYPDAELLIAADDDHQTKEPIENPGVHFATKAAASVRARFAVPRFCDPEARGTDFNDLAVIEGAGVVRSQILAGFASEPVEAAPGERPDMEEQGSFRVVRRRRGRQMPGLYRHGDDGWRRFASLIEIEAETRDHDGESWGRLLLLRDRDGTEHRWAMPMSLLAADGAGYRERLLSIGAELVPGPAAKNALHDYFCLWRPGRRVRCVDRTGWHGDVFVLPDRNYAPADAEELHLQGLGAAPAYAVSGTLEEWQESIGAMASGNSRLVLGITAALAGPLLHPMQEESGGFHFAGASSTGKTTSLHVAASVWGSPIQSWRTTDNAAEALAAGHSDTLLPLDEIGQADERAVNALSYMLANGAGKSRMRRDATARPVSRWRILFMSTGEIGLADKLHEGGKRARGGQSVRVIELAADAGKGAGCFEELHEERDADAFARMLRTDATRFHGTLGRAFLERFCADPERSRATAMELRAAWVRTNMPPGVPGEVPGQVARVAGRFGLVAAAGELAIEWGLLPWLKGEATLAAARLFGAWLDERGGLLHSDIREGLRAVHRFLAQHGSSRFENAWSVVADEHGHERPVIGRTIMRAGYRRLEGSGDDAEWHFFFDPEVWRSEVLAGFDYRAIGKHMVERGWMMAGDGKNMTARKRVPGHGNLRFFHVTPAFMAAWGDERPGKGLE